MMRIFLVLFVVLLNFAVFLCQGAFADVIISEIMYNADKTDIGDDFNKEWVEIFNTGSTTVDLGGWIFEDIQDSDAASPIPNGTMLNPGQALVLTGDSATFDTQWGSGLNRVELNDFPVLANSPSWTNETLALKDSFGNIKDTVNYDDEGDWPTDVSDGPSIYLKPEFLSVSGNNTGTHWKSSTPGIDGANNNVASPYGEIASPGFVATESTIFPSFTPSPDAAWSMVVFPDTQNYVKTQSHLPLFVDMVEWVRDNRADFNIQVVLQEGDLVNRNSDENPSTGENPATLQWQNAQATMSILNGEVPYVMTAGNHDTGVANAENRTTRLNDFFSASDNPLNDPYQGGILKGVLERDHLENAYYELTAPDGREMLIFSLAWDPQSDQLDWANQVAGQAKYAEHTAVLVIHDFLKSNGDRSGNGENVWDEFVSKNENVEIVFNGHFGGDGTGYLVSTGDEGNQVHQMFFNTQFEGNGGNGWIRVIEFLDDGETVRVRTFSPTFGYIREDAANAFTFEISQNFNPADFDHDGDVDGSDFLAWQTGFGNAGSFAQGDANGDGIVDALDFAIWSAEFGANDSTGGEGSFADGAVPEPSTLAILALSFLGCVVIFVRRN